MQYKHLNDSCRKNRWQGRQYLSAQRAITHRSCWNNEKLKRYGETVRADTGIGIAWKSSCWMWFGDSADRQRKDTVCLDCARSWGPSPYWQIPCHFHCQLHQAHLRHFPSTRSSYSKGGMGNVLRKFKLKQSLNGEMMVCFSFFATWQL
jgi:hypothetical protein